MADASLIMSIFVGSRFPPFPKPTFHSERRTNKWRWSKVRTNSKRGIGVFSSKFSTAGRQYQLRIYAHESDAFLALGNYQRAEMLSGFGASPRCSTRGKQEVAVKKRPVCPLPSPPRGRRFRGVSSSAIPPDLVSNLSPIPSYSLSVFSLVRKTP